MTHDVAPAYNRFMSASHQQSVDHGLRRARALTDKQSAAAQVFPDQVIDLFTEALETRDCFLDGKLGKADLADARERYVSALAERPQVRPIR